MVPDSFLGYIQFSGNLLIGQPFLEAEQENLLHFDGHLLNDLVDLGQAVEPGYFVVVVIYLISAIGFNYSSIPILFSFAAPLKVKTSVFGNGEEEAFKAGDVLEALFMAPEFDKGFLYDIFCQGSIGEELFSIIA